MTNGLRKPVRRINTGQTVRLARWVGEDLDLKEPLTRSEWECKAMREVGVSVPFRTLDQIAGEAGVVLPTRRDGRMSRERIGERLVAQVMGMFAAIDGTMAFDAVSGAVGEQRLAKIRELAKAFTDATPEGEPGAA